MNQKKIFLSAAAIPVLLLSSCIGVSSSITLRRNGSGTMSLEYHIPLALEALGQLDGNAGWLTIPVGKADFERTLDRLPGIRMVSFSSQKNGKDLLNRIELEFSDMEALLPFLDAAGQGASLSRENGASRLSLTLSEGLENPEEELLTLLSSLSDGYKLDISFSVPEEASLALYSGGGKALDSIPSGTVTAQGKQVSFTAPMAEVLSSREGLRMEISW
ncbi:MAG: hypothetical protein LBP42_06980 [Treponema sp.]|jgi:hypothetical protein|nr:hypothetical protein [Treponema sp.]